MSDFSDFITIIKGWANRSDWSDALVTGFIRDAEGILNQDLRIDRMIQFDEALITSRCAPLPDDWLQMELVRIPDGNFPDGFRPIRFRARDEFFNSTDHFARHAYTIQGRQIWIGGSPDEVEGRTVKITYYGEVPVFSADQDSWVYTRYQALYRYAAMANADLYAVGEEEKAVGLKQLVDTMIQKLNNDHILSRASGSRLTRSRARSFG